MLHEEIHFYTVRKNDMLNNTHGAKLILEGKEKVNTISNTAKFERQESKKTKYTHIHKKGLISILLQ